MKREEFQTRYELIEQVTEGVVQSHHALHHSGVVVMVHQVGGTREFQDRIEAAARRTGGDPPDGQIMEVHQIDDQRVIVTRFLMDFWSLERWIGLDPDEVEGHQPPAHGDDTPGDFTRMFQAVRPPEEPPALPPRAPDTTSSAPPAPPSVPDPPATAADADAEPGEFTRLFATPRIPSVDGPAAPAPPSTSDPAGPGSSPPAADDEGPGEFTRFFNAPQPPPAQPGPPTAPPPDGLTPTVRTPGVTPPHTPPEPSWSEALRDSRPKDRMRPPPPAPTTPESDAEPPKPGGFTQMFGAEQRPTAPISPAPSPGSGTSDRPPSSAGSAPPSASPSPTTPTGPTPPKSGGPRAPRGIDPESLLRRPRVPRPRVPRMNTRRAAGMAVAAAGALKGGGDSGGASAAAGGEGQASKKGSSRGLVIGLGAVGFLVLVLLAFFAFWDFSGGEVEGGTTELEAVPGETTGESAGEPPVSDPSSSAA